MSPDVGSSTLTRSLAARVKTVRKRRGWSAAQLAERMTARGFAWDRFTVQNLENGRRQAASVEEWLALAYVLDVAPIHLLVPVDESAVRVVPISSRSDDPHHGLVSAADTRRWINGEQPLPETDVRIYFSEVDEETFRARFGQGSKWEPSSEADDGER